MKKFRKARISECRRREIAEYADLALLQQQPTDDLHAARGGTVIDLWHQRRSFGIRQEVGRGDKLAGLGLEPGQRLVIAQFALWQGHHRLQVKFDLAGCDRLSQRGDNGATIQSRQWSSFAVGRMDSRRTSCELQTRGSRRIRAFGADDPRKILNSGSPIGRMIVQRRLVGRHRTGKPSDRYREPLELVRERLRRRRSAFNAGVDLSLDLVQAAVEFSKLASQIAGATGEFGELVADFNAIMLAGGNHVINRERRERTEPGQR